MDKAILFKEIDEIEDKIIIDSAKSAINSFKIQLKNFIDDSFNESDFHDEQFSGYSSEKEYVSGIFNNWVKEALA